MFDLQNQHFSFSCDTCHSRSFDKITSFLQFQTVFHAKLSLAMVYEVQEPKTQTEKNFEGSTIVDFGRNHVIDFIIPIAGQFS